MERKVQRGGGGGGGGGRVDAMGRKVEGGGEGGRGGGGEGGGWMQLEEWKEEEGEEVRMQRVAKGRKVEVGG